MVKLTGYSCLMADEQDVDKLEREAPRISSEILSPPVVSGGAQGLGAGEPVNENADSQREQLLKRIEEKNNALQYMGQGHPKRAQFEHELSTMKKMLEQIEQALHLY